MTKPLAFAALALALALSAAAGTYTYPECSSTGTGCCAFGTGSMRNRGYVVMEVDGEAMIVTCKSGTLLCTEGNPDKAAVASARTNVTCPDFTELLESRSTVTYLEGVTAAASSSSAADEDESAPGTVSAAVESD
jgi:hypothetical protein